MTEPPSVPVVGGSKPVKVTVKLPIGIPSEPAVTTMVSELKEQLSSVFVVQVLADPYVNSNITIVNLPPSSMVISI